MIDEAFELQPRLCRAKEDTREIDVFKYTIVDRSVVLFQFTLAGYGFHVLFRFKRDWCRVEKTHNNECFIFSFVYLESRMEVYNED